MTPDDLLRLSKQLQTDEGCKLYAYTDTLGFLSLGYGRLIDRRKGGSITLDEAAYLLQNDIARVTRQLDQYAWYSAQDSVRQAALGNLAFNTGTEGLLHFPHFLGFMMQKDYDNAVKELVDTPWHQQVGKRADRIIELIRTGAWPQ